MLKQIIKKSTLCGLLLVGSLLNVACMGTRANISNKRPMTPNQEFEAFLQEIEQMDEEEERALARSQGREAEYERSLVARKRGVSSDARTAQERDIDELINMCNDYVVQNKEQPSQTTTPATSEKQPEVVEQKEAVAQVVQEQQEVAPAVLVAQEKLEQPAQAQTPAEQKEEGVQIAGQKQETEPVLANAEADKELPPGQKDLDALLAAVEHEVGQAATNLVDKLAGVQQAQQPQVITTQIETVPEVKEPQVVAQEHVEPVTPVAEAPVVVEQPVAQPQASAVEAVAKVVPLQQQNITELNELVAAADEEKSKEKLPLGNFGDLGDKLGKFFSIFAGTILLGGIGTKLYEFIKHGDDDRDVLDAPWNQSAEQSQPTPVIVMPKKMVISVEKLQQQDSIEPTSISEPVAAPVSTPALKPKKKTTFMPIEFLAGREKDADREILAQQIQAIRTMRDIKRKRAELAKQIALARKNNDEQEIVRITAIRKELSRRQRLAVDQAGGSIAKEIKEKRRLLTKEMTKARRRQDAEKMAEITSNRAALSVAVKDLKGSVKAFDYRKYRHSVVWALLNESHQRAA